jgi:tetratricopeptide (TPR) repeat protein
VQVFKRKRPSRSRVIAVAVFLLAAGTMIFSSSFRGPPPEIVAPANLENLDPQLRDYLSQHLKRAREKPRRADRHATLGLIYAANGLWPEARRAFQNAAVLASNDPLPHLYVGVATQELGDLSAAMEDFRKVSERFPTFAPAYYRLGYAALRLGKIDEAEKAFTQLTALAPGEWRGHAGLGEIQIRRGNNLAAIPLLERSLRLEPGARTVHHLIGQAYQSIGRHEEAELELSLGKNAADSPMPDGWTQLGSQHTKILQEQLVLANEFAETGEPEKAVDLLAKALPYHPNNPGLLNQFAIALNRAGRAGQAAALLEQALQQDERYVPALITLSLCQQNLNNHDQALATAERAIALAPKVIQAHIAKANALLGLERDDDALKTLATATRLDPQNAEIPMEMGDILWRNLNRTGEAKEQYETALKLDPALVPAYVRLGDLSLQMRDLNQVRNCIAKLRRLSPMQPRAGCSRATTAKTRQ